MNISQSADADLKPLVKTKAELTIVVVSYNTCQLTLKCLQTLFNNAGNLRMHVVVLDNASHDGSATEIPKNFPDIEFIANAENIGFARANNLVAASAQTEWLLLLNPDTETHPRAIENLLTFAKTHPEAGIVGGRTVFPDGSLNIASCWRKMTPWSLFCATFGLTMLFPRSNLFNPEAMGNWQRDSVRQVDIVVGCFLMIRTALWQELGGFDPKYFMYGEEADLCLRAAKLGYRPMITPDAEIMHLVGASSAKRTDKVVRVLKAKATLLRAHWPAWQVPVGLALLWLWGCVRRAGSLLGNGETRARWKLIWSQRRDWLAGY